MIGDLLALRADVEQLKTLFGSAMKMGPVHAVDAAKGYRLKLGDGDDGAVLSPWYPHPETGKTSVPMKVGQVVGVVNPTGDPRQGFVIRGGYSNGHPSPNGDMAANVFEDAGVRVSVADGALVIAAGDVTVTVSAAGLVVVGGGVTHDGLNIGSTHVHGGVTPGGADTVGPH